MADGAELDNAATPERRRHDLVEHAVETVAYDSDGRAVRGLADRALGTLERMAKRGAITDDHMLAAERFREEFLVAALEPLRAAQLRRVIGLPSSQAVMSWRTAHARNRVQKAVAAVGRPGGSCLWAVIGEDRALKEWARIARISDENASGVLIAALGSLQAHYRIG
jgi:hypothetical protein